MITEAILNLIYSLIMSILDIIPEFQLGQDFIGGLASIGELLNKVNWVVPTQTLFTIISLWFLFHLLEGAVSLANWLIRKIPTIS